MIGLLCLLHALVAAPFKSKSRLEAENATLRHQLIILRRKMQGRVRLTNSDMSLSQTSSGWQLIENQAILSWDEGFLQTYWLDNRRSALVAGNARGRDLDVEAANKRPAAGCSKETLLQYHRPFDIRWSLSVVP